MGRFSKNVIKPEVVIEENTAKQGEQSPSLPNKFLDKNIDGGRVLARSVEYVGGYVVFSTDIGSTYKLPKEEYAAL